MSIVNNNIKNAAQCVIDWVLNKGYTNVSCAESIANTQISSHPGVDCTGTLVPSDLSAINTGIACLNSCPGLSCTGTLVASDIANKASCTDLAAVRNRVTTLEGCPGLDCQGTLTSANFSLSGSTLTITI